MNHKRFLSFCLALLCMISLSIPAFASGSPGPDTHFEVDIDGNSITMTTPHSASSGGGGSAGATGSYYTTIFSNYKKVAQAILAVCIITSILIFLTQLTKLGAAGDNQMARRMAIKGILVSGLVLAAFGSLELVVSIFWQFLT